VGPHVFPAVNDGLELPLAVGAHERPHLTVRGHVSLEAAVRREVVVTHHTLE